MLQEHLIAFLILILARAKSSWAKSGQVPRNTQDWSVYFGACITTPARHTFGLLLCCEGHVSQAGHFLRDADNPFARRRGGSRSRAAKQRICKARGFTDTLLGCAGHPRPSLITPILCGLFLSEKCQEEERVTKLRRVQGLLVSISNLTNQSLHLQRKPGLMPPDRVREHGQACRGR